MSAIELSVKRIVTFEGEGSLKAFCDLSIAEQYLIKGLRVVKGKKGLFVSMPREQGKDTKWYDSVVTLTQEAKREVERVVLEAYQKTIQSSRA
ncbi:MAG: septation protein SpoVG family protein [Candidatus Omnitrophica bacterium]|nr:septation protein SpoVG family protein [Candidatus Omnitrophota bacterium]